MTSQFVCSSFVPFGNTYKSKLEVQNDDTESRRDALLRHFGNTLQSVVCRPCIEPSVESGSGFSRDDDTATRSFHRRDNAAIFHS